MSSSPHYSSLIYSVNSPSINQYKHLLQCFQCGEPSPQIQCSNCPKSFHLGCSQQLITQQKMCSYCVARKQRICGGCHNIVGDHQNTQNSNKAPISQQQNKDVECAVVDNIRICTLCCRMFHKKCAYVRTTKMNADYQFFNADFNFVCINCLHNRGCSNTIDVCIQNQSMDIFLIAGTKSPIHRTWIQKRTLPEIKHYRSAEGRQLQTHLKTNVANMSIQNILAIKLPLSYSHLSPKETICFLKKKLEGKRCSQYGSVDGFTFLVRWYEENQQEECLFWQDENVALAFPLELCKFLSLLQFQVSKCCTPLHSLLVRNMVHVEQSQQPAKQVMRGSALFEEISDQVVRHLSEKDIHLLTFFKNSDSELMADALCLIMQKVMSQHNLNNPQLPLPFVVVVHNEDVYYWRSLILRYFSSNYTIIIDNAESCGLQIHLQTFKMPKYQILIIPYLLFNEKHIIEHSAVNFQYHLFLQNFSRSNQLCKQALKLARSKDKIVIATSSPKEMRRYILGITKQNKSTLLSYSIKQMLSDHMQLEQSNNDEASLSQSLYQSQEGHSSAKPSQKQIILRQINEESMASSKASSELGRIQRMIFHNYILQEGLTAQLMDSQFIKEELLLTYPSYKPYLEKYSSQCYWQHLQLYVSTLKDALDTNFEPSKEVREFYFDFNPKSILIRIAERKKQQQKSIKNINHINICL